MDVVDDAAVVAAVAPAAAEEKEEEEDDDDDDEEALGSLAFSFQLCDEEVLNIPRLDPPLEEDPEPLGLEEVGCCCCSWFRRPDEEVVHALVFDPLLPAVPVELLDTP